MGSLADVFNALLRLGIEHPVLLVAGILASTGIVRAARFFVLIWSNSHSSLRRLRGPRSNDTFSGGHLTAMMTAEDNAVQRAWVKEYGCTLAARGPLRKWMLVTMDPRAIQHVTFASHIYQKPPQSVGLIEAFLGNSVLISEGKEHRNQRSILNPAFGLPNLRVMFEVFVEKSTELRDIWMAKCNEAGGPATFNCMDTLSHVTLDIIGKAGFGYEFNALSGSQSELGTQLEILFRQDLSDEALTRSHIPDLLPRLGFSIPSDVKARQVGKVKLDAISKGIVEDKKRTILASLGTSGKLVKENVAGKDILSLLMQANLAEDLPADRRLPDSGVVSQIPTLLIAGHETTANTMSWAMYSLAIQPSVQKKLREELLEIGGDAPTLDALNTLPYLDAVVRETLRLYGVVTFVMRQALADDVIPLSQPVTLKNGDVVTQIEISKGDMVNIPIHLVNRDDSVWGRDANQFRPERWSEIPARASTIPGIAPNLLTFIGGPHACIGHRFAVAEIKILLFHIVRAFEFSLAVDAGDIYTKSGDLIKAQLRGSNKVAMPITIKPVV
ncbi:cytochrome P450 [Auriculariales sp. MPI-PUGE-AT-0066]|nr:cytochrome P450 [Auriculariales sp. MPI-PUGE-AT-0066]